MNQIFTFISEFSLKLKNGECYVIMTFGYKTYAGA